MSANLVFNSVSPIGDTDPGALPVQDISTAMGYYTGILGFTVEEQDSEHAALRRDNARIGLAKNGADPEQASIYFSVSDIEAARAELDGKGAAPTALRVDEYGGKRFRVFFVREPYGVCFCFGQEIISD